MTDTKQKERIEAELAFVEDLNELWDTYREAYPDLELELATANLNFSVRSILFSTDPMVMCETISSSLAAWMAFSRKLTEEEMDEGTSVQRVQVISRTEDAPDPELLFLDIKGVKPN